MAIEKIKMLGTVLELPATVLPIQPIWPIFAVNAGSFKTASRILILSIAIGADC